jgi:hypothetical protein
MKRNLLLISALIGSCLTSFAFADASTAATGTMATSASVAGTHPCMSIMQACNAANAGKPKQEVWKTCIKPVLDGQSVSGVNVSSNDVQACKTKMMQRKNGMMQKPMMNGSTM